MKAKVIETGEIIDVKSLYPVVYSRLDGNGKIFEEYDEDELEFINLPKSKIEKLKEKIIELKKNRINHTSSTDIVDMRDCGEYCDALDDVLKLIDSE